MVRVWCKMLWEAAWLGGRPTAVTTPEGHERILLPGLWLRGSGPAQSQYSRGQPRPAGAMGKGSVEERSGG